MISSIGIAVGSLPLLRKTGLMSLALLVTMIAGCGGIDPKTYSPNQPVLDLYSYFQGTTKGWGIVQDRRGRLTRQFTVDISGTVDDDGLLVLKEEFTFSDGKRDHRTWHIKRTDAHHLTGTASDVVGVAQGITYGNALNWRYTLSLELDDSSWEIHFNDWMFLQDNQVLLNRAEMSKFGLRVGEITIAFVKQS